MNLKSITSNTALTKAARTLVQAVVAEVALAGSGYIPSDPKAATKEGVVALAVGLVTLLHNLAEQGHAAHKAKKLAVLQAAIDAAVAKSAVTSVTPS